MLASAVHNIGKYYQRPKRSSNKIRILQTKFEFVKQKTNLTSLVVNVELCLFVFVQGVDRPRQTIEQYQRRQILEKGRVLPQPPYVYQDSSDSDSS